MDSHRSYTMCVCAGVCVGTNAWKVDYSHCYAVASLGGRRNCTRLTDWLTDWQIDGQIDRQMRLNNL